MDPIAQRIELGPSKSKMQVRFLLGSFHLGRYLGWMMDTRGLNRLYEAIWISGSRRNLPSQNMKLSTVERVKRGSIFGLAVVTKGYECDTNLPSKNYFTSFPFGLYLGRMANLVIPQKECSSIWPSWRRI